MIKSPFGRSNVKVHKTDTIMYIFVHIITYFIFISYI